jgi:hypothetical protein
MMLALLLLVLLLPLALAARPQNGRKHLNQHFVRDELASVFGSPFAEQLQYKSESAEQVSFFHYTAIIAHHCLRAYLHSCYKTHFSCMLCLQDQEHACLIRRPRRLSVMNLDGASSSSGAPSSDQKNREGASHRSNDNIAVVWD